MRRLQIVRPPDPSTIPAWAYVLATVSLLCVLVTGAGAFEIEQIQRDGNDRTSTAEQTRQDLERWQILAPQIARDAARVRNDLQRSCAVLRDTNGSLLALVRTLDHPREGVRAKSEDGLVLPDAPASAPSATPSASPGLAAEAANAVGAAITRATPTPAPTMAPQVVNTASVTPDGIRTVRKTLTLTGPYGTVIRDLDQLASLPLPVTINSYTIKRRQDVNNTVEFRSQITLALPPSDVCTGDHT
jgi:hypothetical protein